MSAHLLRKKSKQLKIAKWRRDPSSIEKYQFIYYFVPHPKKQSRATLLSTKAFIIYALFFLSVMVGQKAFTRFFPGVLGYASNIKIKELYDMTNRKRTAVGLGELRLNPALTRAAEKKAQDMFSDDYWAHTSPDGDEPWDFILAEDYDYAYAGENLAKNFNNSKDVVEAWYNSPSHKENLLNKNYEEIGFAVVDGVLNGYETTVVVQMFGKPKDISHLATASDQERILESAAQKEAAHSVDTNTEVVANLPKPLQNVLPQQLKDSEPVILPAIDVAMAIKGIGVVFVIYLIALMTLDIWYSKKHGIAKVTGHTWAHLMFLIASLGMLLTLMPGKIL